MARLHAGAEGVARSAPEVVGELVDDASSYCERGPWSASGYQGPGDQAAGGAARTHAAERCANAAVHTFSCAPNLSDPEGGQVTTASTGLAATAYQELAAAPRAEVITAGDRGYDGAPRSVSQRC